MVKTVNGTYRVADCEHYGDIDNVKRYLVSLGCRITDSYWDGHDCGEAYVKFSFDSSLFEGIYSKLSGVSVSYSEDINDYCDFGTIGGFRMLSEDEFRNENERLSNDYSLNMFDNIPVYMVWECSDRVSDEVVINNAVDIIGDGTEVIGCHYEIIHGCQHCKVLITTRYTNIVCKKLTYGIGDNALGRHGWFSSNRIYGFCRPVHKIMNYVNNYDEFQSISKSVLLGLGLTYRDSTYGSSIRRTFSKSEYIDKDGNFMSEIVLDGEHYMVCGQN